MGAMCSTSKEFTAWNKCKTVASVEASVIAWQCAPIHWFSPFRPVPVIFQSGIIQLVGLVCANCKTHSINVIHCWFRTHSKHMQINKISHIVSPGVCEVTVMNGEKLPQAFLNDTIRFRAKETEMI